MIRNINILVIFLVIFTSCNREFEKAITSKDPELILSTANSMFEEKKWANAISLYEKSVPYFAGQKEAVDIGYNSSTANFEDKNYPLAGEQYKQFYLNNVSDPRAENALYLSAYSYYKGSPEYNLDQTNTKKALVELQNFIDTFPDSEKIKDANVLIDELQEKLEKKAFKIAQSYYKTLEFRAAAVSFDNLLEDFPDTRYREEAMMFSLRAKHDWAVNSRLDRRRGYIKNVRTQHRIFMKAFPDTKFKKEVEKLVGNSLTKAEKEVDEYEKKNSTPQKK